ncbi:MAG: hypothetical protein RL434_2070 [Pseudomonadota bacterium]|jgi:biopolymer transport protein ExbD
MNFRGRRQEDIEVNITSLIDVVLLLLIFFMVSTRFVDESKIDLQLPSASEHPIPTEPASIEIVIDRQGQFFVGGKPLPDTAMESLRAALKAAKGESRDPMVIISADRETDFQRAVDAMDAARMEGLTRITFPTVGRVSP